MKFARLFPKSQKIKMYRVVWTRSLSGSLFFCLLMKWRKHTNPINQHQIVCLLSPVQSTFAAECKDVLGLRLCYVGTTPYCKPIQGLVGNFARHMGKEKGAGDTVPPSPAKSTRTEAAWCRSPHALQKQEIVSGKDKERTKSWLSLIFPRVFSVQQMQKAKAMCAHAYPETQGDAEICRALLFHGFEARIEVSRLFFPFWIPCFLSYNLILFLFSACLCSVLVSWSSWVISQL
ncbi:hypothetical protein BDBG_17629 [Blastomyces gilchristii SLH14081]|uniref:Uncharacterized protein n=1 Tax=Blastomyces gilchristii (strain SLH14081) TaxID=559298 RepID=A0A179UYD5_BLAGS|nr:uncharacterized protein BDBG_17629 [Blastomyces gilchristii SLH14081]OAT12148.1 hypothetical protein BDBG_17629 [Blastomyces gilchristii SLH14081]